jgi:hypothetical protein
VAHVDPLFSAPIPKFRGALNDYAGTYHNPAYGDIIVCPISGFEQHSTCTTVHSDYAAIGTLSNSSLVAYFQRPNAWAKYMSISPSGHQVNTLKVELTTIFPRGYGVDMSPFEIVAHDWLVNGEWQFNAGNGSLQGFGMYDLHDYTSDRHRRGLTVEDRAQVWFAKAN